MEGSSGVDVNGLCFRQECGEAVFGRGRCHKQCSGGDVYAVSQTAVWRSCMREGIVFKQCSGDNVCVADGSMEKLHWGRMVFKQCSGDNVCVADGSMEKLYEGRDSVQAVFR